jgi:outer membrane receptor for monomeric catechols
MGEAHDVFKLDCAFFSIRTLNVPKHEIASGNVYEVTGYEIGCAGKLNNNFAVFNCCVAGVCDFEAE